MDRGIGMARIKTTTICTTFFKLLSFRSKTRLLINSGFICARAICRMWRASESASESQHSMFKSGAISETLAVKCLMNVEMQI